MEIANLTDMKNNLSRYIEQVRRGTRIRILVRGVAVADLVPVSSTAMAEDDLERKLADLERRGLIMRGSGTIAAELLNPGPSSSGKPLSEYLIDERRSGR